MARSRKLRRTAWNHRHSGAQSYRLQSPNSGQCRYFLCFLHDSFAAGNYTDPKIEGRTVNVRNALNYQPQQGGKKAMKYCRALIAGLAFWAAAVPFALTQIPQSGTPTTDSNVTTPPAQPQSQSLRIGSGDQLDMAVFNVPEMSQRQRVDENGDYPVPLVGPVHVAGLTLQNAQSLIASKLDGGHFVRQPSVSLFISDFATQGVSVMGEVTKPGVYPVWGERHLLDMIAAAGGVTPCRQSGYHQSPQQFKRAPKRNFYGRNRAGSGCESRRWPWGHHCDL